MRITEPLGWLMRWQLRLREFYFDKINKQENVNIQADALSRFKLLEHTAAPLDDKLSIFPNDNKMKEKQTVLLFDLDVPEYIVLSLEHLKDPSLLPTTSAKMLKKLESDHFAAIMLLGYTLAITWDFHKAKWEKYYASRTDTKNVVRKALQTQVSHLSRWAKPSRHPSGWHLYHSLRHSFNWPSIFVNFYATVRNCVTCSGNCDSLCRGNKPMKIFPILTLLKFVAIKNVGKFLTTL